MIKFKSKTKDCQLIIRTKLPHSQQLNQQDLNIFSNRYIRGLFKFGITKNHVLIYSGPIGICLSDRMKTPINKYDFFFIMEQIVDLVQKLHMNQLAIEKVVLDPKYVFINQTTKEMQFIYLPFVNMPFQMNVLNFMENIIYSAKPVQEKDTDYISRFVYFIKSMQRFDPQLIEQYILKEDHSIVNTIKKHNVGQSGFMTDKQADYYAHYENDDDSTGLLDDDATGLLNESDVDMSSDADDIEDATGLLCEEKPGQNIHEDSKNNQVHYGLLQQQTLILVSPRIPIRIAY